MNKIAILTLWTLAAGAASSQDDPDLERLRNKQAEVRSLMAEVERTVQTLNQRLAKSDPDAAKRLTAAWEKMRQEVIKEDMEEVERRIASGNLLSAIRKIDEILVKLDQVLKLLLGSREESKEDVPKLPEIRKALDEILKKQEENKDALDKLRNETSRGVEDFIGKLDDLIRRQAELEKETARIPEASLLDLLKEILAHVASTKEKQDGLIKDAGTDASSRQSLLRQRATSIEPKMKEAFEKLHDHGGDLAHKFKAARGHYDEALKAMDASVAELGAGNDGRAEMRIARNELEACENLIREILQTLEDRRKQLPDKQKEQQDLSKKIDEARKEADRLGGEMQNAEARNAMRDAAEALKNAGGQSDQAAGKMQNGNPKQAGQPQAGAREEMEKARDAARKAANEAQSKMGKANEEQLKKIEDEQRELGKQAEELGKKLGDSQAGENMRGAQGNMDKAAQKMGGPQSPQGGNPQGGDPQSGNRDLPGASKEQDEAIKKLREARDQVKEQERQEMLNELEKRLVQMIEEQKKINQTTLDLENRKRQMGDLTRTEKLQILKPASEKQGKLGDDALECKGIAEASGANEIGWAFGMVSTEMKQVSKLLDDNQTDRLTQRKEEFILKTLEALLQAVREKKEQGGQGDQGGDNQDQPQDQPEDQPQDQPQEQQEPQNEPLGVEAEIRLLIELQKHLKWETEEIGKMNEGKDELNRVHREIVGELRKRQADLVDRLSKVIGRVEGGQGQ